MKTPAVVPAIAERKHRTAAQIELANRSLVAGLSGIVVQAVLSGRFEFQKPPDRRKRRGYPLIGNGGIDDRQDPLAALLEREAHAERQARIRSKRKATVA